MEMEEVKEVSTKGEEREERTRNKEKTIVEKAKPYIYCIFSNLCLAAFTIISKVSLDEGMSTYVLVAYGHVFATSTSAVLALLFERKNGSKISLPIWRDIIFLAILASVLRILYYAGLEYTSSTFASAMTNLIPAMTFILAIVCRMEQLQVTKATSQAKIGGTIITFGGATMMTLYKGITVLSMHSPLTHHQSSRKQKSLSNEDWIKGSLILIIHCLSTAAFFILQARTVEKYPAPITLTALTSLAGTGISAIVAAILDHKSSSWKLSWNMSLLSAIFSGTMIFGVTAYLQTYAMQEKGPVFVTAIKPLGTVVVAIMGLLILGETLHLGGLVGATLIIIGLYAILWGMEKGSREKKASGHVTSDQYHINIESEQS